MSLSAVSNASSSGDYGASGFVKIREIDYGDDSGDTRKYLPEKITRFRTASSSGDDDEEVMEYLYTFHTSGDDDIASGAVQGGTGDDSRERPGFNGLKLVLFRRTHFMMSRVDHSGRGRRMIASRNGRLMI